LARQVAEQLMAADALGAHARDEIGITEISRARPLQAALSSAASFAVGAALPLSTAWLAPMGWVVATVGGTSLLLLAGLGALAARTGGAPVLRASLRVTLWGALAMLATAAVGSLFGVAV
jgi:VIT1/CCC1 family predicted Fe2+/Mn2+ transporter